MADGAVLVDGRGAAEEPPARGRGGGRGRAPGRCGAAPARGDGAPRSPGRTSTCSSSTSPPASSSIPCARRRRRHARPRPARAGCRGRRRGSARDRAPPRSRHVRAPRRRALRGRARAPAGADPPPAGRAALPRARQGSAAVAHGPDRGADRARPQRPIAPLARHGDPARGGHALRGARAARRSTRCSRSRSRRAGRTRSACTWRRSSLPVAGDPVYGARGDLGLERQFLHAARLAFEHPFTGERIDVESPLPDDLAAALEQARTA